MPTQSRSSSISAVSPRVELAVYRGTLETAETTDERQITASLGRQLSSSLSQQIPRPTLPPVLLVHDPPYFLLPPRLHLPAPTVPPAEPFVVYDIPVDRSGAWERHPSLPPMENRRSPSPPADWVEGMPEANQCPICYERQIVKKLTCDHGLCTHCYNRMFDMIEWGQDSLRCPLCRGPLRVAVAPNIPIARELDFTENENHFGRDSGDEA